MFSFTVEVTATRSSEPAVRVCIMRGQAQTILSYTFLMQPSTGVFLGLSFVIH